MKSIALVNFDLTIRGGAEHVTISLANELCAQYHVHLLSLCCSNKTPAYSLDGRIQYYNFGFPTKRFFIMKRYCRKPFFRYLKEHNISLVIAHGAVSYLVHPFLHTKHIPFITVDHNSLLNNDIKNIVTKFIAAFHCDKLVTLTDRSLDEYGKILPFLKSKGLHIYNWIDLDAYHSDGYDISSKKILSAGRFTKEKGFEQLLYAFAPVAKARPDWSLDLWGDGPLRGELEEQARRLGIAPQVRFMGMRNDLAAHYQDYAMYVLPSYREGLPLVLLEAKACRLPIVSFDVVTGPREIMQDGVDGFLVEERNIPAMSEKILLLVDNPDLRQRMSDHSQENLDQFSKEAILQQWISLIEELQNNR